MRDKVKFLVLFLPHKLSLGKGGNTKGFFSFISRNPSGKADNNFLASFIRLVVRNFSRRFEHGCCANAKKEQQNSDSQKTQKRVFEKYSHVFTLYHIT